MSKVPHNTYAQQQVMFSSPAKLVAMCYEKTISCLQEAIAAIERGDIEGRWKANSKAMEIISHLWATLDLERGGDIARNLDALYNTMMHRLPQVDFKNDPQPALDVIKLLEPLRDAWVQLAAQNQPAPAPIPATAPASTTTPSSASAPNLSFSA
ncbi:MAG: flagellar export chaperone FliS [Dongiaceae bacterium]